MINIFAKIQHFLHIFPLYNDEELVVLLSISSPKKQKKKFCCQYRIRNRSYSVKLNSQTDVRVSICMVFTKKEYAWWKITGREIRYTWFTYIQHKSQSTRSSNHISRQTVRNITFI